MELPYDPAVPFLGIYLKKMGNDEKRYMPAVFTAALFTIAVTRKQPKGLSNPVDEGIRCGAYICLMDIYWGCSPTFIQQIFGFLFWVLYS